jgi:hypothetical protein
MTDSRDTNNRASAVKSLISGGIDPVKPRLNRVLLSHDANFHDDTMPVSEPIDCCTTFACLSTTAYDKKLYTINVALLPRKRSEMIKESKARQLVHKQFRTSQIHIT